MRPRDWMGVVVRGIGLWFVLQGVFYFFSLVMISIRPEISQGWKPIDYVLTTLMYFVVGATALLAADFICNLLYPEPAIDLNSGDRD